MRKTPNHWKAGCLVVTIVLAMAGIAAYYGDWEPSTGECKVRPVPCR